MDFQRYRRDFAPTHLDPPVPDGDRLPDLDISTTSQTTGPATGANALTIRFSDDGFGPTIANFTATSGGTLRSVSGNSLTYSAQVSPTNTKFSGTQLLSPNLVFTTGIPYSGTRTGSRVLAGPYALTQTVVISHGGAGVSSTDSTLTFQPTAPARLAILFGSIATAMEFRSRASRESTVWM